jgi:hypothetical protein
MDDKDINNIHAWRMWQKGKATAEDQLRTFEIHKAILSKESRKECSVTTGRNLLLDMLIHRDGVPKGKAYKIVGYVENVSGGTVRKDYNAWEKQSPEDRQFDANRYYEAQSNFIDQGLLDTKLERLQAAIKDVMGS